LTYEGYLRRLDQGTYVLGDRVTGLVGEARAQLALTRVRPALTALRDEVRAAAYLCLYEEGEIVIRDICDGPFAPRVDLWVGFGDAGHATALGKCILTSLTLPDRLDYLARHPLVGLTLHTVTDRTALLAQLSQPLARVLTERQEYALDVVCVAAPVLSPSGVGAVALSAPVRRLRELEDASDGLLRTAVRISRAFALTI
jgi:DNA-binding IclR family transcriptional regulator